MTGALPSHLAGVHNSDKPVRWVGLDVLRGLSIAAMILVNNPGSWAEGFRYAPLCHADWHGCTFTDLVFPTFLFCAGVAIVPALSSRIDRGQPWEGLVWSIGKRVLLLVLLGLLLSAFPLVSFEGGGLSFEPLLTTRFPGVLQRIGVCYGVAALLFLFTEQRTQRRVMWASLLLYWPLITLVPVPGFGAPDLSSPQGTLQGFVDVAVFGDHIYKPGIYDPEGLLSTIPALATCLFGVEAGRLLKRDGHEVGKSALLLRRGALLMVLGAVWGWFLPINKYLWTSSYAVWTAGIATVGLGLCTWTFEPRSARRYSYAMRVYGTNALLVFVGSGLLARTIDSLIVEQVSGERLSLKRWLFETLLLPIGDDRLASLAFALVWVVAWFAVLALLYRKNIIWKV